MPQDERAPDALEQYGQCARLSSLWFAADEKGVIRFCRDRRRAGSGAAKLFRYPGNCGRCD